MDMAENTTSSVEVKKKYNNKKKQNLMVFRPDGKKIKNETRKFKLERYGNKQNVGFIKS